MPRLSHTLIVSKTEAHLLKIDGTSQVAMVIAPVKAQNAANVAQCISREGNSELISARGRGGIDASLGDWKLEVAW